MQWSRVLSFADPLAFQAAIRTADVELFPIVSGNFHAELTQISINRLLVHRLRVSLPEINTVSVKPDRILVGFLTEPGASPILHCGQEVMPGDIVVSGSEVIHQRSDANLHYGTISLSVDDLNAVAETIIGRELPKTAYRQVIRPDSALMVRLLKLHKSIGQLAQNVPNILECAAVRQAFENEFIHVMVRCLAEGAGLKLSPCGQRHDEIVARFKDFLAANPDRPLYLNEICAAIGVAERTLRASCEAYLGMGPIRYLTLRRMHLVQRALLHSDPSRSTVTQIVTDHGFWELGRFSVAYRALFGESPSYTLRRPTEQLGA